MCHVIGLADSALVRTTANRATETSGATVDSGGLKILRYDLAGVWLEYSQVRSSLASRHLYRSLMSDFAMGFPSISSGPIYPASDASSRAAAGLHDRATRHRPERLASRNGPRLAADGARRTARGWVGVGRVFPGEFGVDLKRVCNKERMARLIRP